MNAATLSSLACPGRKKPCGGALSVSGPSLKCRQCGSSFPIVSGIAVLVPELEDYFYAHAKGIGKLVNVKDIPAHLKEPLSDGLAELEEQGPEHIEEDLEAERVNALYCMTHFLKGAHPEWRQGTSPLIDELIAKHWDQGPFSKINELLKDRSIAHTVELGCGVGGLLSLLPTQTYLGIDSSFASVAIARHVLLGAPYPRKLKMPADLLFGSVSRDLKLSIPRTKVQAEFVVGDLDRIPARAGAFDLAVSLNTIDMLFDPKVLPETQYSLLKPEGLAIQSAPYIWHEAVAERLRKSIPKDARSSAEAVRWLFEKAGFEILEAYEHVPWLFYKHLRQLEIYSVHLMLARRTH